MILLVDFLPDPETILVPNHLFQHSPLPSTPEPDPSCSHLHLPPAPPLELFTLPREIHVSPLGPPCSRASLDLWIVERLSFTLLLISTYK